MITRIPPEYIDAYKRQEMTIYDIAAVIGKAPSTVWHGLRYEQVDTSKHRIRKKKRNKQVLGVYQAGEGTLEEIGEKFDISKQRVSQIISGKKRKR